ncbi:dihydrofolate reductase family protein [Pseudooceanicola sp. C21-150M6]|uniref:dihydrofolate reductase family protein n=1 Tax=Pseudooceanicola sp. C21-150M6 TaxID=3434355 RepID=UPI003D7F1BBB
MPCHIFIATSLDGFIARPDGALDWLERPGMAGEDHGYSDFIAGIDCIVMGRGSFDKVLTFDSWPYSLPVVVLSQSLTETPPDQLPPDVTILSAPPEEVTAFCAAKGWTRLYIDGGRVIQDFLRAGLIDDMILTRLPVLLGQGIPLFGPLGADLPLHHQDTRSFPSGLIQSHYRCAP